MSQAEQSLSKQLEVLRQGLYEHTLKLSFAARRGNRDGLEVAGEELIKLADQWGSIIPKVAELERLTYNTSEALAVCQDEEG